MAQTLPEESCSQMGWPVTSSCYVGSVNCILSLLVVLVLVGCGCCVESIGWGLLGCKHVLLASPNTNTTMYTTKGVGPRRTWTRRPMEAIMARRPFLSSFSCSGFRSGGLGGG
jgi:hypothetical protein